MPNKLIQRYISSELTHFVGRKNKSTKEKQYKVLVKILREGLLTPTHKDPERAGYLATFLNGQISNNRMFNPENTHVKNTFVICFCDIPVVDQYIHMSKYGQFGISFRKEFLIQQGANPVFYIAKNSKINVSEIASTAIRTTSRADYFNGMFPMYHSLFDELRALINQYALPKQRAVTIKKLAEIDLFLKLYTFSFLKFFDDAKNDDDHENYYMEREWRIVGDLKFEIKDVHRVVLPKSYVKLFRKDVSEFNGQISFAD